MIETAHLLSDIGSTTGPYFIGGIGNLNGSFASYSSGKTNADDTYAPWVFGVFGISSASRTESVTNQSLTGSNDGTYFSGLLISEVNNRRPCMVSAFPGKQHSWYNVFMGLVGLFIWEPGGRGHSWVCDGCNQFYSKPYTGTACMYSDRGLVITKTYPYGAYVAQSLLHMNWGWGGLDKNLNIVPNYGWYDCGVSYTQSSSSSTNYQYFQTVIYNIHL